MRLLSIINNSLTNQLLCIHVFLVANPVQLSNQYSYVVQIIEPIVPSADWTITTVYTELLHE